MRFLMDNLGNHIDISWSGKWRDNEDEMFKEIVIKPTSKPE
jgi:hypothetical protein